MIKDLTIQELQNKMNMSLDLLLYNIADYDNLRSYASEELMILITKLRLYLNDINLIENETTLRLIALKEIIGKNILFHKSKMIIQEEINLLSNLFIIFHGQRQAIHKEIDSVFKIIELDNYNIDQKLITEKYNKVLEYATDRIPIQNYQHIDNLILKTAIIERELEVYVYRHKKDFDQLLIELDEIDGIEKTMQNKNYLLDRVLKIERDILLFQEYSNHPISDEVMKKLYKVKFDILTSDIHYRYDSPISKEDKGIEYYKNMITDRLHNILKGNNPIFNQTFSSDIQKAVSIIQENLEDMMLNMF